MFGERGNIKIVIPLHIGVQGAQLFLDLGREIKRGCKSFEGKRQTNRDREKCSKAQHAARLANPWLMTLLEMSHRRTDPVTASRISSVCGSVWCSDGRRCL